MLTVNKLIARAQGLSAVLMRRAPTVSLDWDVRQKSRFDATDSSGRALGVFLPRGSVVRGGDVLVAEDGSLVAVQAAAQPVLVVMPCPQHGAPFDLLRAAYHLGNRHVALELRPDRLLLEPDHVLAGMLRQMHLDVVEAVEPFEPEGGAYAAVGAHHSHAGAAAPWATTGTNTAKRTITTTGTGTTTGTDPPPVPAPALPYAALLQLIWLASPALPVGGFSYSEVLEPAVEAGLVAGEAQASRWLGDQLHLVVARSELPVVAQAFAAWQRGDVAAAAALNAWVTTTRESSELRQQTEQMGRSLVEWLKNGDGMTDAGGPDARIAALAALKPAPCWPVAFALAAVRTGAPLRESLLAFAFGWAENMVQAALKSVPLGQNAGQRILRALAADIPAAVAHAMSLPDDERQAFAPMLAILSARHETQYSRLFRS